MLAIMLVRFQQAGGGAAERALELGHFQHPCRVPHADDGSMTRSLFLCPVKSGKRRQTSCKQASLCRD